MNGKMTSFHYNHYVLIAVLHKVQHLNLSIFLLDADIVSNKKPSCRQDSWPYCLTADYLVIIIVIVAK